MTSPRSPINATVAPELASAHENRDTPRSWGKLRTAAVSSYPAPDARASKLGEKPNFSANWRAFLAMTKTIARRQHIVRGEAIGYRIIGLRAFDQYAHAGQVRQRGSLILNLDELVAFRAWRLAVVVDLSDAQEEWQRRCGTGYSSRWWRPWFRSCSGFRQRGRSWRHV